jgi:hypothetical protein
MNIRPQQFFTPATSGRNAGFRNWKASKDRSPKRETTTMTKNQSLATRLSTTLAGTVLAVYAIAFLINATNWV